MTVLMNHQSSLVNKCPMRNVKFFQKLSFKNLVFEDVLLPRGGRVGDAGPGASAVLASTDSVS